MLFYVAAIIVALFAQPFAKQAIAYWIATFVPQVVLILLFLGRLHVQFRRLVKGDASGAMRSRFRQGASRMTGNGNTDSNDAS